MSPLTTRRHRQSGLAVVEFTMVVLMLLVFLFCIIDFGRIIIVNQVMMNLSREGANLASRGTTLADTVTALRASSSLLDIDADGQIIVTEISADLDGNLSITAQQSGGGLGSGSRIGTPGGTPTLPATDETLPQPGRRLYTTEVFYRTEAITPIGNLLDVAAGGVMYDVAYF